jgi:hypothetical protein
LKPMAASLPCEEEKTRLLDEVEKLFGDFFEGAGPSARSRGGRGKSRSGLRLERGGILSAGCRRSGRESTVSRIAGRRTVPH